MNERVTTLPSADYGYGISQEQRHKVLRNTYWLLALSLLPTVLGGGTPFYPAGHRWDLSLAESRVFRASGWTYLRYTVQR